MTNKILGMILAFCITFPINAQEPPKPVDVTPKVDFVLDKDVEAGEIAVVKANLKEAPPNLKKATLVWKVTKNNKEYNKIILKDTNEADNVTADSILFGVGVTKSTFKVTLNVVYNIDDKFTSSSTFEKSFTVGKDEEVAVTAVDISYGRTQLAPKILEWQDADRELIRIHLSRTYSNLAYEIVNNVQLAKTNDFVKLYKNRVLENFGDRANYINNVVEKEYFQFTNKNETLTAAKRKDIAKYFHAAEMLLEEFAGLQPPAPPTPPTPVVPRPEGFAGDVYDRARDTNDPKNCLALASALSKYAATLVASSDFVKIPDDLATVINELKLPKSWTSFGNWSVEQLSLKANTPLETKKLLEEAVIGLNAVGGKKSSR